MGAAPSHACVHRRVPAGSDWFTGASSVALRLSISSELHVSLLECFLMFLTQQRINCPSAPGVSGQPCSL